MLEVFYKKLTSENCTFAFILAFLWLYLVCLVSIIWLSMIVIFHTNPNNFLEAILGYILIRFALIRYIENILNNQPIFEQPKLYLWIKKLDTHIYRWFGCTLDHISLVIKIILIFISIDFLL
jgi:hypothetical protein